MSISDVISAVLAVLSLVFVGITLAQNAKMLYANARPYLVVYFAYEENNGEMYICVKNCGNSSAIIRSLQLTPDLSICQLSVGEALVDTMLAPDQQIHFNIPQKTELMQNGPFQYKIAITYDDVNRPKKTLAEHYTVDINYMLQVLHTEHSRTNLNRYENAIINLEKDVKAIVLSNL